MREIKTQNKDFFITSEIENQVNIELTSCVDDVSIYKVWFSLEKEMAVPEIKIKWHEPMLGALSMWGPDLERQKRLRQWGSPQTNKSDFCGGAPVMAFVNQNSTNYSTFASSEGEYLVKFYASVNDFAEKEQLDVAYEMFGNNEVVKDYTCYIRIDNNRKRAFHESIMAVSGWWNEFYPNTNKRTVNGEYPLYSSWYNYHQHPESFTMEKELEIAAELGFKSVIIDDGWSYDGNGCGDYSLCGSWEVVTSKFPDFKGFVEKAHKLGLKVALWFPVPFIGTKDPEFEKYRDKYLFISPMEAGVLDPRYKESRDYIINSYRKIVDKYNLDGLKLDFIDQMSIRSPKFLYVNCGGAEGKDCDSIEEGEIKLLNGIKETFEKTHDDFMIEFRQRYFGPSITRYCNMLRVGDCPFDLMRNRIGVMDLRLMNYNVAVHADMLYWAKNETIENCALQLLNIFFSVPQISVLLTQSSPEQLALIKNYIGYWYKNHDIILHGKFKVLNSEYNYTFASSESDDMRFAVSYLGNSYTIDGKATDLFNASEATKYFVENATDKTAKITVFDCMGKQAYKGEIAPNALAKIPVSTACRIEIR